MRFPPCSVKTVIPAATRSTEVMIISRNVLRTPSSSPFPQYCAVKMPIPESPPKTQRFHTNKSEFTIDTPVMESVPIRPTMILSSIFTKFVIPFCIMIGSAIIIVRLMNSFLNIDRSNLIRIICVSVVSIYADRVLFVFTDLPDKCE